MCRTAPSRPVAFSEMTDIETIATAGFAVANLGLLTGIFFRLGTLHADVTNLKDRIEHVEERLEKD